jgi:hypothetical protein
VSRRAVYDGIERGEVPAARLGRRVFVTAAAFLRTFGLDGAAASSQSKIG